MGSIGSAESIDEKNRDFVAKAVDEMDILKMIAPF
jgi:hypothetical protein